MNYNLRVIRSVKDDHHKQLLRDSTGTGFVSAQVLLRFHLSVLGTNAQHLNLWCWFSTPMLLFAPFCFSTFNPFHSVHRNACPLCHVAEFVHNAAWRKRFGRCVALYPLAIKLELSALIAFSRFSQCCFFKKSAIHL